ncbi:MAG: ribosome maturation factor RimM [Actinobacteria bacterium]|nr:MAG: ribosome maturation factor RimM [Actinomycetota bacterium]
MEHPKSDFSGGSVPDLLEVGHIRRAHGLRGEVFVQLTGDGDARVAPGAEVHAGDEILVVETSRVASNGRRVVKFAQITDRTAAEKYANVLLKGSPIDDPDALWVHELIGGRVVELDGTHRGICTAVLANPAADILELDSGHLVPSNFIVTNIDGVVTVDTPDGLFDIA